MSLFDWLKYIIKRIFIRWEKPETPYMVSGTVSFFIFETKKGNSYFFLERREHEENKSYSTEFSHVIDKSENENKYSDYEDCTYFNYNMYESMIEYETLLDIF